MPDDYPPLLSAGLHQMTMEEAYNALVASFNPSERRAHLHSRMCAFLQLIDDMGLSYTLWIDGSFVSEKPEPGDVDLVVAAAAEDVNGLGTDEQAKLLYLFRDGRKAVKLRYECDPYFMIKDDPRMEAYWRKQFGSDRSGTPKGIIEVTW